MFKGIKDNILKVYTITGFLITIVLVLFTSCNQQAIPEDVDEIIALAGENGEELRSAIHHYRHPSDSLKLQALYFLISEMKYKYSHYGEALDVYESFFDNPTSDHNTEWKKYIEQYGEPDLSKCEIKYDYELIKADFLINNIDNAFYTWQHFPWCKNMSYETFCDYILPYRCGNEHLTDNWRELLLEKFNWLPDSVEDNVSLSNAYSCLYRNINKWMISEFSKYPIEISLENLLKFKDGKCQDENNMYVYACRAMGISVESDLIPGWGKRKKANHQWHILVDEENNRFVMSKDELCPINSVPVNASYFTLDSIGRRHIPSNYQVLELKGITKVYRTKTSEYPGALPLLNKGKESIPVFFNNVFLKDVTAEYIPCTDMTINEIKTNKNYAYLCVFSSFAWDAHSWAEISGDRAVFKDIGFDALYLPATYSRNQYIPVGMPFILDTAGNKTIIIPDKKHTQTLRLNRKNPLFANIVNHANKMIGGRFELAGDSTFSDAKIIHTINTTPLFVQEFTANPAQYRYLRYVAPIDKPAELAELSVEIDTGKGFDKLQCATISDTMGVEYDGVVSNANKIIDENYTSYFTTKNNGGWVGLDLGPQLSAKQIKVKFCPRNDDNFVTPGKTYELRYWDNKWVVLGIKKAKGYWIEFNDVPKNAIYWLHCLNGGSEERIFTVNEDGMVLWW